MSETQSMAENFEFQASAEKQEVGAEKLGQRNMNWLKQKFEQLTAKDPVIEDLENPNTDKNDSIYYASSVGTILGISAAALEDMLTGEAHVSTLFETAAAGTALTLIAVEVKHRVKDYIAARK